MNTIGERTITLPSKNVLLSQFEIMERMVPLEHFWPSVSSTIIELADQNLSAEDLAKHLAEAVKNIPVDGALLRPLSFESMSYVITELVSVPQQRIRVMEQFEKEMGF